jgi:Ca-activated chloride channel family protein
MTFAWPWMLLTLLAVPLLVVAYRAELRRRARRRDELARLGLAPAPRPARQHWRHLAPVLLLGALTLLLFSLARPSATVTEPHRQGTVILAFDISTSMAAKDLAPTRLDAAKAAARAFVQHQPSSIRLGVVAFGDSGLIAQQPTLDRQSVLDAIARLTPQGGTAVGRGILTSLSAIAGKPLTFDPASEQGNPGDSSIGFYSSAAVVLLSDGENTVEPDPVQLAQLASTAGVKIYPIGLGKTQGTVLEIDGFQISTALDEKTLRRIAATTDGTYYSAADAAGLSRIYSSINLGWTTRTERHEVTSWFTAAAALLLLAGATVSVVRSGRVI